MTPELVALARSFPSLAEAPGDAAALAWWAITNEGKLGTPNLDTGDDAARVTRLLLAGFVLAHVPARDRGPLVAALAWPSPNDPAMSQQALAMLGTRDRERLLAWSRENFAAGVHGAALDAARRALVSPRSLAAALRLEVQSGDDATGLRCRCPRSVGSVWVSADHEGPGRHVEKAAHACTVQRAVDGVRFACASCGIEGDGLVLIAAARGVDPQNTRAVLREAVAVARAAELGFTAPRG